MPSSVATMPEGQVHSETHTSMQAGGLFLFAHVTGQALPQVENTWLFGHTWVGSSVVGSSVAEKREREREREEVIQMVVQTETVVGQLSGVTQTPLSVVTMPWGQVHFATHS